VPHDIETPSTWRAHLVGSGVAVLIAFALAMVGQARGGDTSNLITLGFLAGLPGVPVVGVIGWWLGPRAAAPGWPDTTMAGVKMGIGAAVGGDILVSAVVTIGALSSDTSSPAVLLVGFVIALVGLFYAAMFLVLTIPAGLAWALAVRAIASVRPLVRIAD
jgi:hypothetical protein